MSITELLAPEADRLPAPRVTGRHLESLLRQRGGYLVQDAAGAVYPLPDLSEDQAQDATVLVLLDYAGARSYLLEAGGETRYAAAARALSADLFGQHARGLL